MNVQTKSKEKTCDRLKQLCGKRTVVTAFFIRYGSKCGGRVLTALLKTIVDATGVELIDHTWMDANYFGSQHFKCGTKLWFNAGVAPYKRKCGEINYKFTDVSEVRVLH